MARKIKKVDLTRAFAISADEIYIACSPETDDVGYPFTRLSHYKNGEWNHQDLKFWLYSMAEFKQEGDEEARLVVIGQEGEFVDFREPDKIDRVFDPKSKKSGKPGFGYIYNINQIGAHLYVCGMGGQNYKRLNNGTWVIIDETILDVERFDNPYSSQADENLALLDDPEFLRLLKEWNIKHSATSFQHITGLTEDSIYICGGKGNMQSALRHNTGDGFKPLAMNFAHLEEQTSPSLNQILFEDGEERMRICGQEGAMLIGNARDGFVQDPAVNNDDLIFYNMAYYKEQLIIASHLGLLVHTGSDIHHIQTGLEPGAIDTHTVQVVDDVIWAVGAKDILRFDGKTWQRIQYPGNNPL